MLCVGPGLGCSLVRVQMEPFCILYGGDCDLMMEMQFCSPLMQTIMKEDKLMLHLILSCGICKNSLKFHVNTNAKTSSCP